MTFDSIDALKNYILSRCEEAVKKAQLEVHAIIDRFLMEYYAEFDPSLYVRTYQLLHSLVKSDVKSTGNGYVAEVYFDLGTLNYSVKSLQGIGTWGNTYHQKPWNHGNDIAVFEMAAHGSHGGYIGGTAIWDDPMKILDKTAIDILKKMLIDSGISVK